MKGYYKVPRRDVYCRTVRQWLAEVILCFAVHKLSPPVLANDKAETRRQQPPERNA